MWHALLQAMSSGAAQLWGGLDVARVSDMREDERGGSAVVVLHGWGAPGDDLVPLAEALQRPGVRFFVPAAPLPEMGGGRAWWHLDPYARPPTTVCACLAGEEPFHAPVRQPGVGSVVGGLYERSVERRVGFGFAARNVFGAETARWLLVLRLWKLRDVYRRRTACPVWSTRRVPASLRKC